MPEPGNPQAYNRYAYVYGNPMRYFDPSGHIRSDQRERERAKCIVLHLRQAGVVVNEDWGWGWMQNANMEYEQVWVEGNWEIDELEAVLVVVDDASQALGGMEAFRERVGTVHVTRARRSSDDNLLPWRRGRYADTVGSYVTLFDECFDRAYIGSDEPNPKAVIVHEFGHVWDNGRGEWGSELIDEAVGDEKPPTKYAETNRREHWADLVETSVYPGVSSQIRPMGPWHRAHWGLAVQGWAGPVSAPGAGE